MIKKIVTVMFLMLSISAFSKDIKLELDHSNRIDSWTSRGNMMLKGMASDNKVYQIRLTCLTAERNLAHGFAIGEMHIYKGLSHVGSKASFEYDDCISLYEDIISKTVKLVLDWDKNGYDAASTGKLEFSIDYL